MNSKRSEYFFVVVIVIVIIFTQSLNIIASFHSNQENVYGGVFYNPLDGYSYLAKMRQGWEGSWRFHLPYTAAKGNGTFLFMFYILLGHIASWLHLTLPFTFHLARFLASIFFYLVLFKFSIDLFGDPKIYLPAFVLCSLGSGLGWLFILSGKPAPDFWLSEAYPLLSNFANPHFPLGLGLFLLMFPKANEKSTSHILFDFLRLFFYSFILANVFPFGIVLILALQILKILMGKLRIEFPRILIVREKPWSFLPLFSLLIGGLPVVGYQLWVANSDALLELWNAQNITPLPDAVSLLIAFSPALPFALIGGWEVVRKGDAQMRMVVAWGVIGLILAIMPLSLQRRFLAGEYIPIALLAVVGLDRLVMRLVSIKTNKWFRRGFYTLFALSIPTNLILWATTLAAIQSYNPLIYLSRAELDAFDWVNANTQPDAVILASSETGLFIPPFTGRRVIYGHPFETVNAKNEEQFIKEFFTNELSSATEKEIKQIMISKGIDLLFWGPRERQLSGFEDLGQVLLQAQTVYRNTEVSLYRGDP